MVGYKQAFAMSPDEVRDATPPGTAILSEQGAEHGQMQELRLVPQPSSDPLDPLNWTTWRKLSVLICMSLYAGIGNFTSASIASAFPLYATPLAFNPPVSIGSLTHLIAVNVLMMGAANIWWVPLANIFGRRPIILGNILLLVLCSMWAGLAKTFASLLAARIFMGVAGCYTVSIALGPIIGGITGGYIAGNQGLAWIHWVNVILSAILLVACFFLVPESLYKRERLVTSHAHAPDETPENEKERKDKSSQLIENVSPESIESPHQLPSTFTHYMRLYTYHGVSVQKFLAPWKTLRLPGVWLVMLWYAGLVGGVVTITTVGPTLVAQPPYLWGNNAGLIMVGGIFGAILGFVATNLSADRIVTTKKTLRDGQFVEPEARLPIAIPGLLLATTGLWIFGFCAQNTGPPHMWVGMQFGLGMLCFGLVQAPSIGFNYIIDSYGPIAADCFVAVTCMRAIISFSWTFFAGEWVSSAGPAIPFGVFGALMGVFSLLIIPQWGWGKRTRIATAKWIPTQT
ncbi:major facilitator superfamily domain-containing protein [Penicillium riverlandense]|uniref:major facilitator superfamily domain-containing protein n=1 Tax=Penicillium riverlandense TaxID=1903569 RepID=UPI002548715F|nr:major facilitator superfamily domain-containing protein [Penicillium riverlandense]KAJ5811432.1 major facilitator superfamily domain-containing protein [Penicillium riverlandense]